MNILFIKKYQVSPNTIGFFYQNNKLVKMMEPGYYWVFDILGRTSLFSLPLTSKFLSVVNQEILTKDNIAFRFSFNMLYKITDGKKFLSSFTPSYVIYEAEQRISNIVQIAIRRKISEFESEQLNEKRNEFTELKDDDMEKQVSEFGVSIESVQLRDITFPKQIQELFARQLEAKIRARTDLENARTAVATARALKNAAEIVKENEDIKFFQYLETISKIAANGKHTFVVGDYKNIPPKV